MICPLSEKTLCFPSLTTILSPSAFSPFILRSSLFLIPLRPSPHKFYGVLNPACGGSVQEVVVHTDLIINNIPGLRDPDARFHYFTGELLPRLRSEQRSHTLVYIPDYCDYVRLLRHLKDDGGTSIASINEYMVGENSKVAKIRSLFFEGNRHFLLYTERFHFYRRYRIKGVRHIIFYDLPTYPHFFSEICNLMVESNQNRRTRKQHLGSTVHMIVQKSNLTSLVGILGTQRTTDILSSGKAIHTCVLGNWKVYHSRGAVIIVALELGEPTLSLPRGAQQVAPQEESEPRQRSPKTILCKHRQQHTLGLLCCCCCCVDAS
ncbi:Digestive organ expansion factor [Chionoecetes opilio]|uniref:Digestive organ expansion factor n=1 Tax=Chionoecetes opilio TaxID=41210 RepID=A0A8J4Y239_CHIOP|nr:Digestive organ expansion factor [Chionoecetes opilio]